MKGVCRAQREYYLFYTHTESITYSTPLKIRKMAKMWFTEGAVAYIYIYIYIDICPVVLKIPPFSGRSWVRKRSPSHKKWLCTKATESRFPPVFGAIRR